MTFEGYLAQQLEAHPSAQPRDLIKLCYQAAFGAEHLLADPAAAFAMLEKEFALVPPRDLPLYEPISGEVCRVNLSAWKQKQLPLTWLFRMFTASAAEKPAGSEAFARCLEAAEKLVSENKTAFSPADWQSCLADYRQAGMGAVHHSCRYRELEQPAYRIINRRYTRLFPILERLSRLSPKAPVTVIAIDGRAASGKTTLAADLKLVLDAAIVRMDDFFLPPELRTEARFGTPGGNIHAERFLEEVLPLLSQPAAFSYRIFDCGSMTYSGRHTVENRPFRIVEGSYSCHPLFGAYADLTVFCQVTPEVQMERILHRNGEAMAEIFRSRWIPLEEAYFAQGSIPQKADLLL